MIEVGVDYCLTHHGIRNEDMDWCDFAEPTPVLIGGCQLRPLSYAEEQADIINATGA